MSEKIKKVKVQSGQLALDSFLAKTVPSMPTLRITVREIYMKHYFWNSKRAVVFNFMFYFATF